MTAYTEIVTTDVHACCAMLPATQQLAFGEPVPQPGFARVASAADGSRIGVRSPLAEHETPIVRVYHSVDDIHAAATAAEATGAMVAYGPVQQGDTGLWAILIQGGVQVGLWQAASDTAAP